MRTDSTSPLIIPSMTGKANEFFAVPSYHESQMAHERTVRARSCFAAERSVWLPGYERRRIGGHHENIVIFTLAESPQFREAKRRSNS